MRLCTKTLLHVSHPCLGDAPYLRNYILPPGVMLISHYQAFHNRPICASGSVNPDVRQLDRLGHSNL